MPPSRVGASDRFQQAAYAWLADVAEALGTDDHRFAYRVLRAWLQGPDQVPSRRPPAAVRVRSTHLRS